ncbi:MAG TPA: GntR family transcriptional regulator [Opitutaceae bacterium]|jgi:LacI family transcriptional regulator
MDRTLPKHREISRELLADIASGRYAGGKVPSEAQLVKRFGVSRPTVARALRDLQAEGLIERRAGSGTFVKAPNASPGTPSRQLGLLVPERGTTEIFEMICGEISSLARAHDYALLYGGSALPGTESDGSERHAWAMCEQFIARAVQGVFFAPFELSGGGAAANRRIADALGSAGIPLILLDRDIVPFPQRSRFDLVGVDNVGGAYQLAEHLIKLGCRRIAFLARPGHAPTVDARIAGVREALARQEQASPTDWVRIGEASNVAFVRERLVGEKWEAVICGNDVTAAQLLRTLEKLGTKVPDRIRVVGFDDANFASLLGVTLTTLQQPTRDIAVAAFAALNDRLAQPALPARTVLLAGRLVVRESCGAYLPRD